ncbi:MAG: hypothetical protein ACLGRW_10415 [Acidobacteriota bacterium]
MNEGRTAKSDNLSDFSTKLKNVESIYIQDISAELAHARNSVAGALPGFRSSRMNFGRILRAYKLHYKAARGWTAAMKVIAEAMGCDERTVERIIDDYERASQLPSVTLEVMAEQKIDPAAAKNAPVVDKLVRMPPPATREEAAEAVRAAIRDHVAQKKAVNNVAAKPAEMGVENFTAHVVKLFEQRYRSMAPAQRDAELRYVLEVVTNTLRAGVTNLRQYSRPALVPKAVIEDAA